MSSRRLARFTLLKRREGSTKEEFNHHWHTVHAKVLASQPDFWKCNQTYVQNHIFPWPPQLAPRENKIFDGIAKTYQCVHDNGGTFDYFDQPSYLSITRPDEETFLDYEASTTIYCEERIIKDGPTTGVKLLNFIRPLDGMDQAAFSDYWYNTHEKVLQSIQPFWKYVRRYAQYHAKPELYRGSSVIDKSDAFWGVVEICFDSVGDFEEAVKAPEIPTKLRPDENMFIKQHTMFLVEERPVRVPKDMLGHRL